jgi:hypothetical protein
VVDKEAEPLSGVVLSLSGEKQYRSNNVTQQNGTINFPALVSNMYPATTSLMLFT